MWGSKSTTQKHSRTEKIGAKQKVKRWTCFGHQEFRTWLPLIFAVLGISSKWWCEFKLRTWEILKSNRLRLAWDCNKYSSTRKTGTWVSGLRELNLSAILITKTSSCEESFNGLQHREEIILRNPNWANVECNQTRLGDEEKPTERTRSDIWRYPSGIHLLAKASRVW